MISPQKEAKAAKMKASNPFRSVFASSFRRTDLGGASYHEPLFLPARSKTGLVVTRPSEIRFSDCCNRSVSLLPLLPSVKAFRSALIRHSSFVIRHSLYGRHS